MSVSEQDTGRWAHLEIKLNFFLLKSRIMFLNYFQNQLCAQNQKDILQSQLPLVCAWFQQIRSHPQIKMAATSCRLPELPRLKVPSPGDLSALSGSGDGQLANQMAKLHVRYRIHDN